LFLYQEDDIGFVGLINQYINSFYKKKYKNERKIQSNFSTVDCTKYQIKNSHLTEDDKE